MIHPKGFNIIYEFFLKKLIKQGCEQLGTHQFGWHW